MNQVITHQDTGRIRRYLTGRDPLSAPKKEARTSP